MTRHDLFEKVQRAETIEVEIEKLASSPTAMMHVNKIQSLGIEYQGVNQDIREAVKVTLLAGMYDE
ncbi:hypothetical protein HJA60_004296 [Vibrio vulnificus]|nr:hypothetical protein [Vibrio vulnificus]